MSDEYVKDPELLQQLNSSAVATAPQAKSEEYVSDPALLQKLNGATPLPAPANTEVSSDYEDTVIPAMGARIPGPTGLGPIASGAVSPFVDAAKGAIQGYKANPVGAVADTLLVSHGLPPMVGGYNTLQSANEARQKIAQSVSQGVPLPSGRTTTMEPYWGVRDALRDAGRGDLYQGMADAWKAGKNDAVIKYLNEHPEIQTMAKKDPNLAAKLAVYSESAPGLLTRAGRIAAPILRGVSKVAAPVGAALEAGQGVQQAQQGDYTGAALSGLGAASMFNPVGMLAQPGLGIMQSANQNFQQQPRYQQRQSVDAALGGTAPGMFGGDFPQQDNERAIQMAVRLKAAKKVLGQP
jgi:hypothetical protein